jgi:predicted phage tail protein
VPGVIPLAQRVLGANQGGLFRWIFGQPAGSMTFVIPAVVMAVAVGLVAALELAKRR